jgi:serine/threonine-protein kinase
MSYIMRADAMIALHPGDQVGQYVLGREIGRGAMGTVFEATHAALGKRVALKALHPHLAADAVASSRFLREGKAAAQIHSANVVDVFDVGAHDGLPYLVMELLEGKDLGAFLEERGKLTPRESADIMVPVCAAVDAAHHVGVIHRDLKPSNVMLATRSGGVIAPTILDFGISKIESDTSRDLTASETLLGTVHYMSPEQTRGARTASARSDQYSLGVILYECVTGAKPFAGTTPYALMHAIVSAKLAPPSAIEPSVPAAFDEITSRAMNRDPARRFQSVRALGAALLPFASEETRRRYTAELGDHAAPAPSARTD